VAPPQAGRGTGTALLRAAAAALAAMGYRQLLSTFLLGNDASAFWHWRNGFQLLPFPDSLRHIGRRFRLRKGSGE
jgi:L-amino acid N-acyltransferase YncA